ncbi:MAG: YbaN family protein [Candidatus Aminicenantes bacterium]|nr:YbaN family protein [Candidatus Aminicenantes bacterium]
MPLAKSVNRALLVAAGALFTALGVIGMFLPLLPTTPFLLLAAWFFARSSKRFLDRLLNNRLCGPYIRNYREGAGISRRRKALTIALLWLTIGVSALFFVTPWWGKAALFVVAVGVTIHLLMMKTGRPKAEDTGAAPSRCCGQGGRTEKEERS